MLMKFDDNEFDKLVATRLREKLGSQEIWDLASDEEILKAFEGTMLLATTRFGVAWDNLKHEIKQTLKRVKTLKLSIFKA